MPLLFKVANYDDTQKYDFTGVASKVRYITGTFQDVTSELGEEPVEMRFSTITKGADEAAIRLALSQVERVFARAKLFIEDLSSSNSVWIVAQSLTSKARRTLVLGWTREDTVQANSDPLFDKSLMVISNWTITRKGVWEGIVSDLFNPPVTQFDNLNSGACGSGVWNGSDGIAIVTAQADISRGTLPGRIRRLRYDMPTIATKPFWKIWLGMKTVMELPGVNYIKPFREFDDLFTNVYDVGNVDTDFVASPALNGKVTQVSFSANNVFTNKFSAPIPNHGILTAVEHQAGTYLILYRMRATDASSSFRVAMFQSWDLYENIGVLGDVFQDVFITSDEFHLYEMGVVQFPPEPFRGANRLVTSDMYNLQLGLAAERLSGSGLLQVDYLIAIPQEHFISASNIHGYTGDAVNIITDEEDTILGMTRSAVGNYVHEITENNFRWPADNDGYLVAVMAADVYVGNGDHPMFTSPTASYPNPYIIPRYFSYNAD